MTKFFNVSGPNGELMKAEQLATFTYPIQNVVYRFVVTRLPHGQPVALTHRSSGKRVCIIFDRTIEAALGNMVAAAKLELGRLIERMGEARVASALRAAE